jgi:hypothetical protein
MGVWSSILLMSLLVGMLGVSAWERHRPRSEARPSGDDQASFRIEVLNGNGRAHEAQALTTHLRGHGYRVDQVGNAGRWDYPHTLVVDRRGDPVRARGVASAVGRGSVVLQRADDGCEVRVILGHDWSPQGDR